MKQDQLFSLVLPVEMLEKLANFQNISVFISIKYMETMFLE